MISKKSMVGILLLVTSLLAGCGQYWNLASVEPVASSKSSFSFVAPESWFVGKRYRGMMVVTKDGPLLQAIEIKEQSLKKAFPKTKQEVNASVTSLELANYYLAELKTELEGISVVEKHSIVPVSLGDQDAFQMELSFNSQSGVTYKSRVLGLAYDEKVITLAFQAPELHYYQSSIGDFESMLETFKLN
ncbi:MAG: hypothetical protein K6L73_12760 [Cellvibrionaceae bacterium]